VQTGRAIVTQPTTREELAQHLQQLLHLHALRQQQRGSVDRFQSPATSQFLHSTVAQLWSQGQAAVYTLAWDGRPAAADLVLLGGETAYAYLAGWDPALAAVSPGNLLQQWIVQDVLRRGCRVLDLLDSAADYGHRWRGKMQPTADIQIQPRVPTGTPGISLSGEAMRAWLKSSLHLNGM
jgi:CelD/BcsL family acetyltransferase involved in cellulose biosynthesis